VRSHEQIAQIRRRIAELKGADLAAIFDAQLLLLDDPMLVGRAASIVMDERVNAEWAVQRAVDELAASSTTSRIRTCANARAICTTWRTPAHEHARREKAARAICCAISISPACSSPTS
jgi:phosphoenolpyruvate-protein kinase (PTS system EI component)